MRWWRRCARLPIADQFSVAVTEYVARDFSLVDVNAAGCSKGTTLAAWVQRRGWTPADVMAVGDNLNDVEMLDFAGTAYVMGNADRRAQVTRLPRDREQRRGGPCVGRSRVSTM